MKAKLLDNLMVRRDEDFRKSLFPFISPDDSSGARFTRFIREKDSPTRTINYDIYSNASGPRINFNPESQPANEPLPLSQLLHRYKDASLTLRKKKLSWREWIVQSWASMLGGLLMEGNVSRVFGKESAWLLVWNILVLFGFLFNIFEIPIAMFFTDNVYRDEYKTAAGLAINWTIISLLLVNLMVVRPNTEFQKMGYLISDRRQIINNYLGLSLAVDLTGLVVLLIYASAGESSLIFLKLVFYIQLRSVFEIDEMMLERLEMLSYRYAFYRLLRLLTYMLFIIIWLSSIFFYIDYRFYQDGTYPQTANWLTYSQCTYGVDYASQTTYGTDLLSTYPHMWYIWLNYAAYWALQTISTVGYGDITPRNPQSVVFTNIAILIMMFFFVFFINSIIEIIDETTSAEQKQKTNNLRRFKLYHRSAKKKAEEVFLRYVISPQVAKHRNTHLDSTADKIRSYLQEMDISGQLEQEQNVEQIVNQSLTPELREELFVNYRQLFFKKVLLFGEVAKIESGFMQVYEQLIYQIKEVAYGSGQIVYSAGEHRENNLYYLLKGCIRLAYPHSRYIKQLSSLSGDRKQNEFNNFGVRGFFTREARDHTAVTEGYCKVQQLNYQDFINIIRTHPHFHRKYCELRDLLLIEGLQALTGEECFECGSRKHHLLSCDRCLFNFPLFSKKVMYHPANTQREQRHFAVDCHRQPYFLRDCIRSQRVPLTHTPQMRQNSFETVRNYDEYFPTRNLNVEYFY